MTTRETRVESAFRSIRVALSLKGDTAFGDYCYEEIAGEHVMEDLGLKESDNENEYIAEEVGRYR